MIAFILKVLLFGALIFCPRALVPLLTHFSGFDPQDENFFNLLLLLSGTPEPI